MGYQNLSLPLSFKFVPGFHPRIPTSLSCSNVIAIFKVGYFGKPSTELTKQALGRPGLQGCGSANQLGLE